jgi:hypothetical protein
LALRLLALGRRPISGPLLEAAMLQKLRGAGFRTLEPLAWGEQRRWGFAGAGFLMVRKIGGEEVADLLEHEPGGQRDALWGTSAHCWRGCISPDFSSPCG